MHRVCKRAREQDTFRSLVDLHSVGRCYPMGNVQFGHKKILATHQRHNLDELRRSKRFPFQSYIAFSEFKSPKGQVIKAQVNLGNVHEMLAYKADTRSPDIQFEEFLAHHELDTHYFCKINYRKENLFYRPSHLPKIKRKPKPTEVFSSFFDVVIVHWAGHPVENLLRELNNPDYTNEYKNLCMPANMTDELLGYCMNTYPAYSLTFNEPRKRLRAMKDSFCQVEETIFREIPDTVYENEDDASNYLATCFAKITESEEYKQAKFPCVRFSEVKDMQLFDRQDARVLRTFRPVELFLASQNCLIMKQVEHCTQEIKNMDEKLGQLNDKLDRIIEQKNEDTHELQTEHLKVIHADEFKVIEYKNNQYCIAKPGWFPLQYFSSAQAIRNFCSRKNINRLRYCELSPSVKLELRKILRSPVLMLYNLDDIVNNFHNK